MTKIIDIENLQFKEIKQDKKINLLDSDIKNAILKYLKYYGRLSIKEIAKLIHHINTFNKQTHQQIRQYIHILRKCGEPIISIKNKYFIFPTLEQLNKYKEQRLINITEQIKAIKNMKVGE